jgi:hypothetical protein
MPAGCEYRCCAAIRYPDPGWRPSRGARRFAMAMILARVTRGIRSQRDKDMPSQADPVRV